MAHEDFVKLDWNEEVATVTMNNPGQMNAFSMEMKAGLQERFSSLMEDPKCRAIILTGAGGNFSAGGDIKQMKDRSVVEMRLFMDNTQRLVKTIVTGPKPVIAAVEGNAYGAGIALAACCDCVVASRTAKFCAVFMRLAQLPDTALRWSLSQRVGPAKAQELITLATAFDGEEALRLGMANRLAEPGSLMKSALKAARRYGAVPPVAFALNKIAYVEGTSSFEGVLRGELAYHPIAKLTNDHREAVAAFKEKRKPRFTGT